MPTDRPPHSEAPQVYQIRVAGHLGPQWAEGFENFTLTFTENGETLLTGPVVDQPELYGLLKRIRNLGLTLLSINLPDSNAAGTSFSHPKNTE